jgi:hypothetical protein
MPWILCGTGLLFCLSGIYFFYKIAFEENRSLKWPVIIMIMGVLLIAWGTAKYVKLV